MNGDSKNDLRRLMCSSGVSLLVFLLIDFVTSISWESEPFLSQVRSEDISSQHRVDFPFYRTKRSSWESRGRACVIFIGIDEPLFEHHDKNLSAVVKLAQDHVEALNDIFIDQVFVDGDNDRYFRLGRVQIMFGSCDGFEKQNCTENMAEYLTAFDYRHDFSDFCLAFMFTYIDFHNNTAGLATVGTVCRKRQNSGFVTLLNNFVDTDFDQSSITFAHEVGHNFGAVHDEKFDECKGQGFIMSEVLKTNETTDPNRRKFSSCSLDSMKLGLKNLTLKIDNVEDCFRSLPGNYPYPVLDISLCGNGVVDPGEQCDCGNFPETCNDDCCYPAHISEYERSRNSSAVFCQMNMRPECVSPRPVIFAVYLPLSFIAVSIVILFIVLWRDWKGEKRLFEHVTRGEIRIVRSNV